MPSARASRSAASTRASVSSAAFASCSRTPPEARSSTTAAGRSRRAHANSACNAIAVPFADAAARKRSSCAATSIGWPWTPTRAVTMPSSSCAAMPKRARCGLAPAGAKKCALPGRPAPRCARAALRRASPVDAVAGAMRVVGHRCGIMPDPATPGARSVIHCDRRSYAFDERQSLRAGRSALPCGSGAAVPACSGRPRHPLRRARPGIGTHRARAGRAPDAGPATGSPCNRTSTGRRSRCTSHACARVSSTFRSTRATRKASSRISSTTRGRASSCAGRRTSVPSATIAGAATVLTLDAQRWRARRPRTRASPRNSTPSCRGPTIWPRSSTRRERPAARRARC